MKRFSKNMIAVVSVFFTIIMLTLWLGTVTSYCVRRGYVVEVEDDGCVICSVYGTLWKFYDDDHKYARGEKVRLKMDIRGTDDMSDDIIIKVNGNNIEKICGYIGEK